MSPSLSSLQSYALENCPTVRQHPLIGRRVVRLAVIALAENPNDLTDSAHLSHEVKRRYKETYGNPLLGLLLLQILVGVIAKLIADWILRWWHERQDQSDDQDVDTQVKAMLAGLAGEAKAEMRAGVDASG